MQKDIQTRFLENRLNTATHHQRHVWKVEDQVSAPKSYFELSSLNNKSDTFFEDINSILSFISELLVETEN